MGHAAKYDETSRAVVGYDHLPDHEKLSGLDAVDALDGARERRMVGLEGHGVAATERHIRRLGECTSSAGRFDHYGRVLLAGQKEEDQLGA